MSIAFLGFGLIGGSVARAVRASDAPRAKLVAWSPTGSGPAEALVDGVIDEVATSVADAVAGADLVILAAPPLDCLRLLDELGGPLRDALEPAATVTDVASTKTAIVARADAHGLPFVGGHPMAGRETTGYGASTVDLFVGRPWVVVPGAHASAPGIEAVEDLARTCGAEPLRMTAADHDAAVAGTSHLPLVLATALVQAVAGGDEPAGDPDRPFVQALTAGGWRAMTRLARGDVAMGAGIAVTNADALARRIRDVRAVLDGWLADLERPDGPDERAIADRLRTARERLERLERSE
jgi:prephenate dehydrogenase